MNFSWKRTDGALPRGGDGERSLTLLLDAFGIATSNDTQF